MLSVRQAWANKRDPSTEAFGWCASLHSVVLHWKGWALHENCLVLWLFSQHALSGEDEIVPAFEGSEGSDDPVLRRAGNSIA